MGIHLFNPPEPCCNPHRDCGNCTGVPCKWVLRIPEYTDGQSGQIVPAVDLLMDRFGKTGCTWALMVDPRVHSETTRNHVLYRAWRLSFAPFVNVAKAPFTQPGYIHDWVVWISGGGIGGDTIYYRTRPLNIANHPDYDVGNYTADRHFACLGSNRFYYWQAVNDEFAIGPGPAFGWPNELVVVPWYGKKL